MAGMMSGSKGMGAARMKSKGKAKPKAEAKEKPKDEKKETKSDRESGDPHKSSHSPRSAHIREAENGFIVSHHGGEANPMGTDHVAGDFETAMALARSHLGSGTGMQAPGGAAAGGLVAPATAPGPAGGRVNFKSHTTEEE